MELKKIEELNKIVKDLYSKVSKFETKDKKEIKALIGSIELLQRSLFDFACELIAIKNKDLPR